MVCPQKTSIFVIGSTVWTCKKHATRFCTAKEAFCSASFSECKDSHGEKEMETTDWERRHPEISSVVNTVVLCTQLVCLTALCTSSWIHCTQAFVVLTPSESIQLNKELHRHSLLLPASPFPVPLSLVLSWLLSRSHKQKTRERERNKSPSTTRAYTASLSELVPDE